MWETRCSLVGGGGVFLFQQEVGWRKIVERLVGSFVVVHPHPFIGERLSLRDFFELVGVQDIFPEGFVQPFNVSVLARLSLFNEDQLDIPGRMLAPFLQRLCNELRAVVHAYGRRQAPPLGQFCQLLYDPFTGNAFGYGDVKGLPVEVIDDVERPEGFSNPERIAHEVHAPVQIRDQWLKQGLFDTGRNTFVGSATQV